MAKLNFCTINEYKTYNKYSEAFLTLVHSIKPEQLDEQKKQKYDLLKLNLQRTQRLDKTFEPSEETKNIFSKVVNPQQWVVITEHGVVILLKLFL